MTDTNPPPSTVVVFGDSIAEALDLPISERANAWVSLVQTASEGKLQLINEGRGGRPTDSLAEFQSMLSRQPKIDVLVIALGSNDARDLSDRCVPQAVAHLQNMIRLARHVHRQELPILIVGPPNIRPDTLGPTSPIAPQREAKLIELNQAFQALALQERCDFISLHGSLPFESLSLDGVHPDRHGHRRIAHMLLPSLLDLIPPSPHFP